MLVRRPDECTVADCAAADRIAGTGTKNARRSRILTRHAKRRAPRNKLPLTAGHDQPCPGLDIGVGKVTDRCRVETVCRVIDNVLRSYAIILSDTVQAFTLLPLMIGTIHG